MSQTPSPDAIVTNKGSPDFNEAHHPYCGLLSSMHTCGIYNGRYGVSRFVVPPRKPPPPGKQTIKVNVEAVIQAEKDRQERLKSTLSKNSLTAAWVENKSLFQNFKQLQFFDTLALYFHLRSPYDRKTEVFTHVPLSSEHDEDITLKKLSDVEYSLDPYPFAAERLKLTCGGWYFHRYPKGKDPSLLGETLRSNPRDSQTVTLVAG
jgi:hypothetical protein